MSLFCGYGVNTSRSETNRDKRTPFCEIKMERCYLKSVAQVRKPLWGFLLGDSDLLPEIEYQR